MPKPKIDYARTVPTHSRREAGLPTWIILNPSAAPVIEALAYALDGSIVPAFLTAYHPNGTFATDKERGTLTSHYKGTKHIKSVHANGRPDAPTHDCSPNEGCSTAQIMFGANSRNVADLLYAAVRLEAGDRVLLWTDGAELTIRALTP